MVFPSKAIMQEKVWEWNQKYKPHRGYTLSDLYSPEGTLPTLILLVTVDLKDLKECLVLLETVFHISK